MTVIGLDIDGAVQLCSDNYNYGVALVIIEVADD